MRDTILNELSKKADIPSFPNVLSKLNTVFQDPDTGLDEISSIIVLDPALSARILSYANSALYGIGKADSFKTAISRIGLERLKKLVYSLKVKDFFTKFESLDIYNFWKHNISVAELSQRLAKYIKVSDTSENIAYFSGLLHDVGIIIFFYIMPGAYLDFIEDYDGSIPLEKAEFDKFGIDHAELGAFFLEHKWQIDKKIVEAVRGHHLPVNANSDIQAASGLVHIADSICRSQGFSYGIESHESSFRSEVWEMLGFSLDDVYNIISDMEEAVANAESILKA